jgi:hypothetical protein
MINPIKKLRMLDRLYFGPSVGRGSAINMAVCLMTGFAPIAFAKRYWNAPARRSDGEISDLARVAARHALERLSNCDGPAEGEILTASGSVFRYTDGQWRFAGRE